MLKAPPLVYQERDTHITTAALISDLHSRMPSICGEKTTFSTSAYNAVSTLTSAASCSALQHPGVCANLAPCAEQGNSSQQAGSVSRKRASKGPALSSNDQSSQVAAGSQQAGRIALSCSNSGSSVLAPDEVHMVGGGFAGSVSQLQPSNRAALSSANKENDRNAMPGSSSAQDGVHFVGSVASVPNPRVEWLSVQQGIETGGSEAGETITPVFGKPRPPVTTKRAALSLSGRGKQTPPVKRSCPDSSTATVGGNKVNTTPQGGTVPDTNQGSTHTYSTLDHMITPAARKDMPASYPSTAPLLGAAIAPAMLPLESARESTLLPLHTMKKVCSHELERHFVIMPFSLCLPPSPLPILPILPLSPSFPLPPLFLSFPLSPRPSPRLRRPKLQT